MIGEKLMELWFSEMHTPNVKMSIRVDKQLYTEESEFQRIDVFQSEEFGRFFTLDGIMMLTEDTADRLKVSNRLNARQSIKAGAVYLNYLKDAFVGAEEPDKTWLALAAYNTGLGGVLGARKLAKKRNSNPNNWYEMKYTYQENKNEIYVAIK